MASSPYCKDEDSDIGLFVQWHSSNFHGYSECRVGVDPDCFRLGLAARNQPWIWSHSVSYSKYFRNFGHHARDDFVAALRKGFLG